MFIETPVTTHSLSNRGLVQGVGVNDADYQIHKTVNNKKEMCPYYRKWSDMIKRCYSSKEQERNKSYIGCRVCDEWILFSNFKKWMKKQDWLNKELDKDILSNGDLIYSPETCLFVDPHINMLVSKSKKATGKYLLGVSFDEKRGKYQAKCKHRNKTKTLGRYDSELEAHKAYKEFKYSLIRGAALTQDEPLRSALLNYVI